MPLYEYQCDDCGHRLEALQKMSDDRLVYCPQCEEPSLRKLISAAAFHLKGTGWYETDFKNNGKKDDKNASADDSSGNSASNGSDKGTSGKSGDSASSGSGKESTSSSGASANA